MWGNLADVKPADQDPAVSSTRPACTGGGGVLKSLHRSMEEMLFMPVEGMSVVLADIPVLQPVSGRIGILLQADKAYEIAGSIFGDPNAALDDRQVDDALAELINTVAGHIMSDLVSAEQEFALGLPTVTRNMHVILDEPSMTYFLTLADACFQLMITGADLITLCNDHLPICRRGSKAVDRARGWW